MSETRHRGTSLAGGGYVVAMVDTPSFEGAAPAPSGLAGDLVLLHQSTPALLVQSMPFTPLLPAPLLPKPLLPKPLLPKPLLRG